MYDHHQCLKLNSISKLGVIVLSIILISGISFIPILQAGVYAQKQLQQSQQPPLPQQQQSNRVGISQVIKQVAQEIATANPGNNATNVYQILVQLAKQTAQTTSKEKAIEDIRQISLQVDRYPYGIVSQSLAHFAQQVVSAAGSGRSINTPNAVQIAQQIIQDKSSTGQNVTQSLVNKAVQTATGTNSNNINQHLGQIAQIISKQTGVPVEKVESILIQLSLQIAQTQGQAITGQSISQIANQITNNLNGIFTQLILQLLKQDNDDNGKSSHTVKIIKTVVRGGGDGEDTNINIKNNINNYNNNNNNQPPSNTDTKTGGTTPALSLGNTPITTGPVTVDLCFVCATGNDVDYQRVNNIATGTAQLTGVSTEAAELAVSDTYLRTANKAGPDQASQALASFEADAESTTTNPATLNKIGDLAKLYDSGHEDIAYQASDSIADKLSIGENPTMALVRTSIPDSTSLSSIDEVTAAVGREQGGGATAIAGGTTTTTNTDTDDGTGDTALGKDDIDTGDTDTGDDGDSGDSGDSGNSGDSGDGGGDSGGGTTGSTSTGASGSTAGAARGDMSTGTSGSTAGAARGGGGDSK
jgi:hypothetical protein